MPDTIIESVLSGKLDVALLVNWLNNQSLEGVSDDCVLLCCNRNEFVACFLSFLRSQTDSILQTNSNAVQLLHNTPEKLLSTRRQHHRSVSDPTSEDHTIDSLSVKKERHRSHESPSKEKKRTGRRVKTKLFTDDKNTSVQSVSSDESRLSTGVERLILSSTPVKNGFSPSEYPHLPSASPVTPKTFVKEHHERCDTPRMNHSHKYSRSQEKTCLGDYMVIVQKSSKKKRLSRNSMDNEEKVVLDLSNSDTFPEIGTRKSSSLRSETRRIKPTTIDKAQKSISLNSFSESIQTSPMLVEDNSVFKQQKIQPKESTNSFEAERNILKQERHKLMEKFNILNTSLPQKSITPQIKISRKENIEQNQNFVKVELSKVSFIDKIDLLVDIYEILLNNNLILSVNTEIYFLISILVSKQYEADCNAADDRLKDSDMEFLLKSIHNCTYFAVKSLWHQRIILEIILDKSSLKNLGENKKVRCFYPDLAKFLLNCYGLRCEAEANQDRRPTEARSNGVVCFNMETDNVDNFPSMMSFQNFKKQRDMYYEILRWYQENQTTGGFRSSLRARVKALLCCGACPTNLARLCALFMHHMLAHCLPSGTQESKLSKLQRRLTCPNSTESHRLPHFTASEMFYKEFIINAESESFRVHLRDAFCSEIIALDATQIAPDDRGNSNIDLSKEYLQLSKKLALLAKFLGFLTSLPYSQVTTEPSSKTGIVPRNIPKEPNYSAPKEKVLENEIALRNYCQPSIDIKNILQSAYENGRLSISIPWIVHYLSMLDYTSLRIKYYHELLTTLIDIYTNRLKLIDNYVKKNTIIYLKSILGWLFDLPHFPQELFYEDSRLGLVNSDVTIDSCDLVDESTIIELCPYLRGLNVLLATCKVSQDQKEMGSYRHITPVSLVMNPEDRMKNKEKELQARLEEEFLKSQPSSTRRVLELVIERITSAVVRELSANTLTEARERAREHARALIRSRCSEDQTVLHQALQSLYSEHLQKLLSAALDQGRASIRARAAGGVSSLVSAATPPLVSLAARHAEKSLGKWLHHNWNSTSVLCKDIESEVKSLISLGDMATSPAQKCDADVAAMTSPAFDVNNVSPAACIINLKEQVCLLLDGEEPEDLTAVLAECSIACSPNNVFGRTHTQRAILQLSVDLCVVFVSRKPNEVTETFLNKLHKVWHTCCPDRKRPPPQELTLPERREGLSPDFRPPTPNSDEEPEMTSNEMLQPNCDLISVVPTVGAETSPSGGGLNDSKPLDSTVEEKSDQFLEFFDRILCPRNIMLLTASPCKAIEVWNALATVLVYLLRNYYLSEDSLTEQCLAVYRQDWPQNILENLSTCMKSVSAWWSRSSTGKFTLFLDFLAEYCHDMDYEPIDE